MLQQGNAVPNHYPSSISEIDLEAIKLTAEITAAVKRFAASKPYSGSIAERQDKFRNAIADIGEASGVRQLTVIFLTDQRRSSGESSYHRLHHRITLAGRLSVITCLHEIAHAIHGPDERVACAWSLRLFRDCFPKSWAKLRFEGHVAVSPEHRDSRSLGPRTERE